MEWAHCQKRRWQWIIEALLGVWLAMSGDATEGPGPNDAAAQQFRAGQREPCDRRLVNKLLVTYFDRDSRTKSDVLALMAKILQFTDDEKERVGLIRHGGWLSWGLGGSTARAPSSDQESLTDMWIEFLLKESDEANKAANPDKPP
eukprot:EC124401.1.p1 GENE.EC124401.1~~EC124401.1.p1  ORF type:complete len:146 (+),score=4.13 EC124401.1:62-499(+)